MSKKPRGRKRSARVASGKIKPPARNPDGKSQAAVQLGRRGGQARALKLGVRRRTEIARKAAAARWKKQKN
jgi:hypothetical protein